LRNVFEGILITVEVHVTTLFTVLFILFRRVRKYAEKGFHVSASTILSMVDAEELATDSNIVEISDFHK
jgi:hypothetical protein